MVCAAYINIKLICFVIQGFFVDVENKKQKTIPSCVICDYLDTLAKEQKIAYNSHIELAITRASFCIKVD